MKRQIFFVIRCSAIILLLLLSPLSKIVLQKNDIDTKVIFILIVSVWALIEVLNSKLTLKNTNYFDLAITGLIVYVLLHSFFLSNASLFYYKWWLYLSYIIIFYLFRRFLSVGNELLLGRILKLFIISALCEGIIGALQYCNYLEVKNDFFKLLGSFTSQNFLGEYLSITAAIIVWFLFVEKVKNKRSVFFYSATILFFLVLLIISNSRSSWLSLIASLSIFLATSSKFRNILFRMNTNLKKVSILIVVFFITSIGIFLYNLKPESVKGRLFASKIAISEIIRTPIGHGMFSFAGKYNKAKSLYFESKDRNWEEVKLATYLKNPFNEYILVSFELGIVVMILLLVIFILLLKKIKINRYSRLGLSIFINIIIFSFFNSPSDSVLLSLSGILGLALMFNYGDYKKLKNTFLEKIDYLATALILCYSISCLVFGYYKLANQNKVRDYNIKENSLKEFFSISGSIEDNMFSEFIIGKKLYKFGLKHQGKKHMEYAFLNSSSPLLGRQLAYIYKQERNYQRAEEIFKFNINVEPYRFRSRMDLLFLMEQDKRFEKCVEIAQEIANLPVKIPSEKVLFYKETAKNYILKYSAKIQEENNLFGNLSDEYFVKSDILKKKLPYRIYVPKTENINKRLPVIYLNDGYNYIRKGNFHKVLDSLVENKIIKPVTAVFLEPRDENNDLINVRKKLFLCNDQFNDFFVSEFMPLLQDSYPITTNKDDTTIMGVSFGGLAAMYLANKHPDCVSNISLQSPAFHPCPDIYNMYSSQTKNKLKIYLSYGTGNDTENQDIPMVEILQKYNHNLKLNIIEGGNHNWKEWTRQFVEILIYFYGTNATISS